MRIQLIEGLLKESLPSGAALLVEYDPTSAWYQTSISIAAGWLREGGVVSYHVAARSPESIRSGFTRLGMDAGKLEEEGKLRIFDWYTATLGRKSNEKYAFSSLKVADLSPLFSRYLMASPNSKAPDAITPTPSPEWLRILDDASCLARFNEERAWVEFVRTRVVPIASLWKSTGISGIMRDVHSEWAYRSLEAANDGVIDFKLDESGQEAKTILRIRSMRDMGFDSRWHPLRVGENFDVTLGGSE